MKVLRVLNNNVVLAARADGGPVVLTGKGLGFNTRPGDEVDPRAVRRTFVPDESRDADTVARMVADVPADFVDLAADLLAGHDVPASTVIALADHLNVAVRRNAADPSAAAQPNPLAAEVSHLYPQELATARELLARANGWITQRGERPLPAAEETAIALHLVGTGFQGGNLAATYQMTGVFSQLFDVIDAAYGTRIDRDGLSAARFITHMRYFFVRVDKGEQLDEGMGVLGDSLAETHLKAISCADRLAAVLELRLNTQLTADERAYLALHVVRLTAK